VHTVSDAYDVFHHAHLIAGNQETPCRRSPTGCKGKIEYNVAVLAWKQKQEEGRLAKVNLSGMNVQSLLELREAVEARLEEHRRLLEKEIHRIAPDRRSRAGTGRKVAPKYRSKKDPNLTWAGRGAIPHWLRNEMKGSKLKREAFLIK
jgi:DNA-binding protein H-NS